MHHQSETYSISSRISNFQGLTLGCEPYGIPLQGDTPGARVDAVEKQNISVMEAEREGVITGVSPFAPLANPLLLPTTPDLVNFVRKAIAARTIPPRSRVAFAGRQDNFETKGEVLKPSNLMGVSSDKQIIYRGAIHSLQRLRGILYQGLRMPRRVG